MQLIGDQMCFGCGQENPIGLRLRFDFDGQRVSAEFTPRAEYQGYAGLLHGGIMSAALDEAMGRLVHNLRENAVTAELNVRLKKPVRIGETLTVVGELKGRSGRLLDLVARATFPDGTVAAEATAKFIKVKS